MFRNENIKPKTSADMQPIRKKPTPTVNNQGKVRRPEAHLERNTQNPNPIHHPPIAQG